MLPTVIGITFGLLILHAAWIYLQAVLAAKGSEGKPMDRQEDQRFETIRLKVVLSFMWTVWTATTLLCFLIGAAQSFRRKKVLLFHSDGEIATVPLATFISSLLGMLLTAMAGSRCASEWRRCSSWCKDKQMMDLMLSFMMAVFAAQAVYSVHSAGTCEFGAGAYRAAVNSVRILTCVVHMNPVITAVWTVLHASCYMVALSSTEAAVFTLSAAEVVNGVLSIVLSFAAVAMTRSLARSEGEASLSRKEVMAVKSLLSTTCDVLVQVDRDLKVAGPHPALAAFLFRQEMSGGVSTAGSSSQLANMPFQKFIATKEDQEVFKRHMTTFKVDPERPGLADAFQVSLKDGLGNEIRVQIFHIPFEVAEGEIHHLIGLLDSGEFMHKREVGGPQRSPDSYSGSELSSEEFYSSAAAAQMAAQTAAVKERRRARRQAQGSRGRGTPPQNAEATPIGRSSSGLSLSGGGSGEATTAGGTPPVGRAASVRSSNGSTGSSSGGEEISVLSFEDSAAERYDKVRQSYLRPDLRPTSRLARELSLIRTMLQWNMHVGGACCSFHAGIRLLSATAAKMTKEDCLRMNWSDVQCGAPQCTSCGLLVLGLEQGKTMCQYCEQVWDDGSSSAAYLRL